MVSETVLSTLAGVIIGSLLTGVFNYLNTQQQVSSANQRQRAEFVEEKKTDELLEISKIMSQTHRTVVSSLLRAENGDDINTERVAEASINYRDHIYVAQMFLDDNKMSKLNDFYNELITAEAYIMDEIGENLHRFEERIIVRKESDNFNMSEKATDFDLEKFEGSYRKAIQVLRWEMVEPVERIR